MKDIKELERLILSDEIVDIMDAAGSDTWCMGDLEYLGWAKHIKKRVSLVSAQFDVCWEYTGPNKIKVGNQIMKKGDKTQYILKSYD